MEPTTEQLERFITSYQKRKVHHQNYLKTPKGQEVMMRAQKKWRDKQKLLRAYAIEQGYTL